jgi:hypothetical protein
VGDHQSTYLTKLGGNPNKQTNKQTKNPNPDATIVASGNMVFICKKIEAH